MRPRTDLPRKTNLNSPLPCPRQDPFGILYFSPFPRHAAGEPRKGGAGGGEEGTCLQKSERPCRQT